MEYKYHYTGTNRVHINGIAGFAEPDSEVISKTKINHPLFEPMFEEAVEKEEKKEETKKKKK